MGSTEDGAATVRHSADQLYGDGQQIWSAADRWNCHKRESIERFILETSASSAQPHRVLDAGSGNTTYCWMPTNRTSIDRFYRQVEGKNGAVVCDIESLPFSDGSYDLIFCIGSVLNYVSALETIGELSRVLKTGGRLYLHFESSASFEQIGKRSWNAPVHFSKTINSSRTDHIWIYSPGYIFRALISARLRVLKRRRFHILSALLLRLGASQNCAALAGMFDRSTPFLGSFADDVIVLAEKI
jgi:SAM-dependent methyltransferase